MHELDLLSIRLQQLSLNNTMDQNNNQNFGIINKPPSFSGIKQELEGFLTRAELAMESKPELFTNDSLKIKFLMSYMLGKPLEWISCLRRNNSPLLDSYEDFVKELKKNFGDYCADAIVANSKLCSIKQRKIGHVADYISEFQRVGQCSDFNESAKIFMFIKGLKYPLREKLAIVNPNPKSLNQLISDVLSIESLTKRSDVFEYYNNRGESSSDPMDVDLFRIKHGQRNVKYFPANKKLYNDDEKKDYSEERKKGLCFICGKPGHVKYNCPNRTKPKGVKLIKKLGNQEENESIPHTTVRRIRKLEDIEVPMVREIVRELPFEPLEKKNILEFYIQTNESEEKKVRVLIDSGSDLNFIHPGFLKYAGIKTQLLKKPFNVSGLGYGVCNVAKETEKCILRFKNHLEVIQLYVLRIPDVDIILGLPWIEKHSPTNYHNYKKIAFSSGYCARHCNNGKRKRKNKKRTNKSDKLSKLKEELKIQENKASCSHSNFISAQKDHNQTNKDRFDFKCRAERTINDEKDSDYDSVKNLLDK